MKQESVAWGRLMYGALALLAGVAGAYWGQPLIHGNKDAIGVIVNVYSILAGLLIAVITVLGSTESLVSGSWRAAIYSSEVIRRRLLRHRLLFKLYLITLAMIFVSMLVTEKYTWIKVYLEYGYLFCATIAFMFSMTLPSALMKVQEERLQNEVSKRRSDAGIVDT